MELEYQLTVRDYIEALKSVRSSEVKWFTRIFVMFALLIISLEVCLLILGASDERLRNAALNLRPLALFLVIWVTMLLCMPRLSGSKQFRGTPVAQSTVRLTVLDSGLRFRTSVSDTTIQWKAFTKFIESEGLFIYSTSAKAFNIIPKRAFTPDQLETFRQTLMSNGPKLRRA